jgi:hypothetical protein
VALSLTSFEEGMGKTQPFSTGANNQEPSGWLFKRAKNKESTTLRKDSLGPAKRLENRDNREIFWRQHAHYLQNR